MINKCRNKLYLQGEAWLGKARRGEAWRGKARRGKVFFKQPMEEKKNEKI